MMIGRNSGTLLPLGKGGIPGSPLSGILTPLQQWAVVTDSCYCFVVSGSLSSPSDHEVWLGGVSHCLWAMVKV